MTEPVSIFDKIRTLSAQTDKLSAWEKSYIADQAQRLEKYGEDPDTGIHLSEKQRDMISRIFQERIIDGKEPRNA